MAEESKSGKSFDEVYDLGAEVSKRKRIERVYRQTVPCWFVIHLSLYTH